jgi:hypothetical protein
MLYSLIQSPMITSTGSLGWLRASWAIAARRSVTAPEQPAMRIGRWEGIVFVFLVLGIADYLGISWMLWKNGLSIQLCLCSIASLFYCAVPREPD